MKRALILVFALAGSIGLSILSIAVVMSSSRQFARRVSESWQVGEIELGAPRVVDINTAGFATLDVSGIRGRHESRSLQATLHLVDVEWRRDSWRDFSGPFTVPRSEVRFAAGELDVLWTPFDRDGDAGGPMGFVRFAATALPERVAGQTLQCAVRNPDRREPWLEFRVDDLSWEQAVAGPRMQASLASDSWTQGLLELTTTFGVPELRVHLDDVDLTKCSLRTLAAELELPWCEQFPDPKAGRADIDLGWRAGVASLRVRHYQTRMQLAGLRRPLERLSGEVVASDRSVEWTLSEGWYSRSKVTGSLRLNRATGRLTGEFRLLDVVGDPDLADPASALWHRLLSSSRVEGRCDVVIPVDALLTEGTPTLLSQLELVFEGVRERRRAGPAAAAREDGLSGNLRFQRRQDQWTIEGSTAPSSVRGFRLPASRWQGTLDDRALRLDRHDLTGPRVTLEVVRPPGGAPSGTLRIDKLDLGEWLGRGLSRSEAFLQLLGDWHESRGLSYTGWLRWNGLVVPDDTGWPVRRPHSEVQGEVFFNRQRGQEYLPSVAVSDGLTLWLGSGWVDREGAWDLQGVAAHGTFDLPPAFETPDLIRRPRPGWQSFTIRGPLLHWSAHVIPDESPR
ncbi:MAG: hypothetical protein AB7O52_09565 [Planctomycetota bacterium]